MDPLAATDLLDQHRAACSRHYGPLRRRSWLLFVRRIFTRGTTIIGALGIALPWLNWFSQADLRFWALPFIPVLVAGVVLDFSLSKRVIKNRAQLRALKSSLETEAEMHEALVSGSYALYLRNFERETLSFATRDMDLGEFYALNFRLPVPRAVGRQPDTTLLAVLAAHMPVFCIGNPADAAPPTDAFLLFAEDEEWRRVVKELAMDADLVFLYVESLSAGIEDELAMLGDGSDRGTVVLLTPLEDLLTPGLGIDHVVGGRELFAGLPGRDSASEDVDVDESYGGASTLFRDFCSKVFHDEGLVEILDPEISAFALKMEFNRQVRELTSD